MMKRLASALACMAFLIHDPSGAQQTVLLRNEEGRTFEGLGALSAGASSRLLIDYPEPYRSQVLDYLFKPRFGASFQHLKVEIGGDVNSTDGTEPSHARTREELRAPKPEYYQRGFEWWLMKEAKKRNPDIFLDCLIWGCPGWIGEGRYYSEDNAEYIASFIEGARKYHGLTLDYTGVWNERPYDTGWIKRLRRTLDARGLAAVKIVAADVFDWNIADSLKADPDLDSAVAAIGIHYVERWEKNPYTSTPSAQESRAPLWNSEGGPWRGDWAGFSYLARMYNRDYIEGRMTKQIIWSLVTSYYDNLSIPRSGVMSAKTPWSGYYEVEPALWAVAHTTQFVSPGWKYVDGGCGYLDGKGSYVTFKESGGGGDFSIVIETMDAAAPQTVSFQIPPEFKKGPLHVWRSTLNKETFERLPDLLPVAGGFSLTLDPQSLHSLTTTTGQQRGAYVPPPPKAFPFPYRTGFEEEKPGTLPRYFIDQAGIFEVREREDGAGQCVSQLMTQQGIEWESGDAFVESVLGDTAWTDCDVSVRVRIAENTGYAVLMGRVMDVQRGHEPPEGYWLKIPAVEGWAQKWRFYAGSEVIATGPSSMKPFQWHALKLSFKSDRIAGYLDGQELFTVRHGKYTHGLAGLGSGFNRAEFDDLVIE